MPLAEIMDKLSIHLLRDKYLTDEQVDKKELRKIIEIYAKEVPKEAMSLFNELKQWNEEIWLAEAKIREFQEATTSLADIATRALMIRDFNVSRVAVKKKISEFAEESFCESKHNYAKPINRDRQ